MQLDEPKEENEPKGQAVHAVAPVVATKVPAGQLVQELVGVELP